MLVVKPESFPAETHLRRKVSLQELNGS